ncbi:proline-rich transmembrane protein 3 isoform X1 [Aquarana catesbeiana]|uniref:proline-rich transmembrane protein 3 isoform X1 n=1 Tax=Aquarana catesbeiana TaxID=8400 RepID=UPI003CC99BA3
MADRLHLRVVTLLAILVVIEPSTSLFEVDADNSKAIHKLDQGNSFKNTSDGISESELEVQNFHNPNVFSKEERNHEELYHPKLPGRRVGGLTSTAASIPGERSEENVEEAFENISNEFPPKESKKMLDSDEHKHNKMLSRTTAGKSSEKSGHVLSKIQPTISKMVESDLETKDSKVLLKQDKMVEMPSSQSEEQSLPKENDVESDNIGLVDSLTTVHPVVSTIALLTGVLNGMHTSDDEPFTPLQKLQIESADEHEKKAILGNAVESQENFIDQSLRAEDNFLDENVNPKVIMPQPTEQYQAAVRTDSYSTLQDAGPEGNEVISADVEFLHADGLHYQKDGNIIPEGATAAENETDNTHILSFSEPKKTLDTVVQINYQETHTQPYPSTPLPTMWPHFIESDLPHGTAVIKDYVTLEAKARTETERILLAGGGKDGEASGGTIPISTGKTSPSEVLSRSPQAHETPKPAMQVQGKNMSQTNNQERPSAQPGKGPPITQRNAVVGSAPPGLVMSTTWRAPVTKPQDPVAETQHPQLAESSTTRLFPNVSKKNGRRGEIRVTTQRAFRRPQLIDVPTSFTSMRSTLETPICNKNSGTCEFVGTNKTLLKWDDLRHTLSFAWDMHVYGTGSLFLLLSLIALVNLIGSPILQVTYLPYVIVANGLLFAIGILRGVFFLLDPYGTKGKISRPISLVLCNVTFPLMISTFATLVLLVLKIARLQLLPPKFQSLALLAVIAVIHFIVLLSADLLTHLLNPSVNMVLQILSISWGIFLMVGNFVAYYRLRKSSKDIVNETQRVSPVEDIAVVQTQGRSIKCMFTSSRVLLVSSIFGLLCCGMQVYAILWLYGLLGQKNEFFWSWWFLQFWYRIFELVLCFSMIFVASHSFCLQCSSSDHTCWSKIISYFCTYKKTEAPEYPNNCYDWTNGIQDKMVNNNISKTIIRNHAENVPLRIIKENNEAKGPGIGNNSRSSSPLFRPKPEVVFAAKSQNITMGRSYTSICFEKESMLSLADLEFRPPSPINLSRSIDEALFREHLVRDSIFLDSSLQYPSYLTRQDSCSSLKECSAMNQTIDPLISADLKMRRCSNPDYLYSLTNDSSTTEMDSQSESTQQSKELPRDVTTEPMASVSSIDSISKGSIKISWNPWRHGLSSVESLPLEDTPSSQLLKQGSQPSIMSKCSEPEKSFGRRFMEKSQTTDSNSIASETIEL